LVRCVSFRTNTRHTDTDTDTDTDTQTKTHTHTHARARAHTHTHMHIHTHLKRTASQLMVTHIPITQAHRHDLGHKQCTVRACV